MLFVDEMKEEKLKPSLESINFDPGRIEGFIESLSNSSSNRPDGVSAKLLKGAKESISHILAEIGRASMANMYFPSRLKIMFILKIIFRLRTALVVGRFSQVDQISDN